MNTGNPQKGGDLEIVSEVVMAEVPRGPEMLRLTFTKAKAADGRDVAWHSIRIYWKTDTGEWRPGKQGVTLRGRELRPITEALTKAVSGGRE